MIVAIVYYSKTSRTRRVAQLIRERLVKHGVRVEMFEVRHVHEYASLLLHFNPRLIFDMFTGRLVEIETQPRFDPKNFDFFILGSPIWFNKVTPAIKSFAIQYREKLAKPIACFTTSTLKRDYASTFKLQLESLGYKVVTCVSIYDPDKDVDTINAFVDKVVEHLKKA